MKIAILAPFGSSGREAGVTFLLANYLSTIHPDISLLRCNGVFSICDRDNTVNWRRQPDSCLRCMADQAKLGEWSSMRTTDISRFILPEDIEETRRLIISRSARTLVDAEYQGFRLFDLCRGSFATRFGTSAPNLQNKNHDYVLRRMMVSAGRMVSATKRFNNQQMPTISLVCGEEDFISRSYRLQSLKQNRPTALFTWSVHERCVRIVRSRDGESMSCDLALDGVPKLRKEVDSWPGELVAILRDILGFLDIPEDQLSLNIAR